MKESLLEEPILWYSYPKKLYVLITDASNYAWACLLTQFYENDIDEENIEILHPITNMSGLFCGSQLNGAFLTKEACAIYVSVKKLAYYLENSSITLQSDHLSLRKF